MSAEELGKIMKELDQEGKGVTIPQFQKYIRSA